MSEAIEQVIKQLKTRAAVVVHAEPEAYIDHLWAIVDDAIPHPEEGSPRAIIVCANDEEARHIEAYFQKAAKKISMSGSTRAGKRVDKVSALQYDGQLCFITHKRLGEIHYVVTSL